MKKYLFTEEELLSLLKDVAKHEDKSLVSNAVTVKEITDKLGYTIKKQ